MSMVFCCECDRLVDSDYDCDGFYVEGYKDKFVCEHCRDAMEDLTYESTEEENGSTKNQKDKSC